MSMVRDIVLYSRRMIENIKIIPGNKTQFN